MKLSCEKIGSISAIEIRSIPHDYEYTVELLKCINAVGKYQKWNSHPKDDKDKIKNWLRKNPDKTPTDLINIINQGEKIMEAHDFIV